MPYKIFPNHNVIKQQRENKGWSQEHLADGAGISTRTLQRVEAGNGCSIETLKNIAAMLEIHFQELLLDESQKRTEAGAASWWRLARSFITQIILVPTLASFFLFIGLPGLFAIEHAAREAKWIEPRPVQEHIVGGVQRKGEIDTSILKVEPNVYRNVRRNSAEDNGPSLLKAWAIFVSVIWVITTIASTLHLFFTNRDCYYLVNRRACIEFSAIAALLHTGGS